MSASLVLLCKREWLPAGGAAEAGDEDYKVCLIRRSSGGPFPNATAFPGGKLDPGDLEFAGKLAPGGASSAPPPAGLPAGSTEAIVTVGEQARKDAQTETA